MNHIKFKSQSDTHMYLNTHLSVAFVARAKMSQNKKVGRNLPQIPTLKMNSQTRVNPQASSVPRANNYSLTIETQSLAQGIINSNATSPQNSRGPNPT